MGQRQILQFQKGDDALAADTTASFVVWVARFGQVARIERLSYAPASGSIAANAADYATINATVNGVASAITMNSVGGVAAGAELTATGAVVLAYGDKVGLSVGKNGAGKVVPAGIITLELYID